MTVHKAKGLEFPVVILADPTCRMAGDVPSRHVDPIGRRWFEPLCGCAPVELLEASEEELRRDRAEGVRVAYVAATRARDLLIVPVCGDAPIAGWLDVLQPVLYPSEDTKCRADPAPGSPTFGDDSVLDRGSNGVPPPGGSTRPGLHLSSAGGPPVAWWDPDVLRLDVEEQAPLRQQHILQADPAGAAAAAGEQMYAQWKSARGETLARASHPSITVQTVTSLATAETVDQRIQVEIVPGIQPERSSGRRFGALVHSLLAAIDFDADLDAVRAAAAVCGRLVAATEKEVDAAVTAVAAALVHPIMRRAAAAAGAGRARRETPVLLQREEGILVEGVVDLAFQQETSDFNGWVVVDFKTSREFEANQAKYTAQVGLYVEAIHKATRLPTKGALLVV
jgi:ATP-dependent exoDNAse (exonuclease V) beta subunit